jgi:(p)ppGpp synthase/HD superfamily hydrolase
MQDEVQALDPLWLRLLLSKCIAFAGKKHRKQIDKLGRMYIDHPLRVMMTVNTIEEKIVAVLHDVIEDTDTTYDEIRDLDVPEYLIEALECITKRDKGKIKEPNDDYIDRVLKNPIATEVKLADLGDNMSPARLNGLDEFTKLRLIKKYRKSYNQIMEHKYDRHNCKCSERL